MLNKFLLGAVIGLAIVAIMLIRDGNDLQHRMDEMNCVHYIYEDGSAIHIDAEVAQECLMNH